MRTDWTHIRIKTNQAKELKPVAVANRRSMAAEVGVALDKHLMLHRVLGEQPKKGKSK